MIGDTFRKRREELNLDLREISNDLRIRYEYLKALEDDNFEKFPAEVYIKGYIREYARYLDIDPEPLIGDYGGHRPPGITKIPFEISEVNPERKKFRLPKFLFFLPVLAVILLVLITSFPKRQPPLPQAVPEKPQALPAAPAEVSPAPAQVSPPPEAPAPYTLTVTATDTTWLRIELDEGSSEEALMKPGDTMHWTSENGFTLKLGNAGGVRLALNDKDLGIPGEKGHVVKLRLP